MPEAASARASTRIGPCSEGSSKRYTRQSARRPARFDRPAGWPPAPHGPSEAAGSATAAGRPLWRLRENRLTGPAWPDWPSRRPARSWALARSDTPRATRPSGVDRGPAHGSSAWRLRRRTRNLRPRPAATRSRTLPSELSASSARNQPQRPTAANHAGRRRGCRQPPCQKDHPSSPRGKGGLAPGAAAWAANASADRSRIRSSRSSSGGAASRPTAANRAAIVRSSREYAVRAIHCHPPSRLSSWHGADRVNALRNARRARASLDRTASADPVRWSAICSIVFPSKYLAANNSA